MIAETLQKIVESTPGAQGAILMDADGIAIDQYMGDGNADVETIAMEFSARFAELRKAARSLELGKIADITLKAERATMVVRFLGEFYIVLVLDTNGNMGKGRWKLRSSAAELLEFL
ncbi:MAG: roadblock/LC7 domain-containing protein [Myxococcales bacterium]|nr:roadblock/LC7 domain-containing protein [Myxococcales bacterium]MCB9567450.1 roadblock/LC7 domain-containing protein [Myxococcales bacterium]MCB9700676.1 roadblock/LC7 domain-containing protein [Myxococcales bacterium]